MKVQVIKPFFDITENTDRSEGDVFTATEARAEELMKHAYGPFVKKFATRTAKKKAG